MNGTEKVKIIASRLAGRREYLEGWGGGVRYHARIVQYDDSVCGTAICGATYGKRSGGWSYYESGKDVNCPRCVKKLERMGEYEKVSRD